MVYFVWHTTFNSTFNTVPTQAKGMSLKRPRKRRISSVLMDSAGAKKSPSEVKRRRKVNAKSGTNVSLVDRSDGSHGSSRKDKEETVETSPPCHLLPPILKDLLLECISSPVAEFLMQNLGFVMDLLTKRERRLFRFVDFRKYCGFDNPFLLEVIDAARLCRNSDPSIKSNIPEFRVPEEQFESRLHKVASRLKQLAKSRPKLRKLDNFGWPALNYYYVDQTNHEPHVRKTIHLCEQKACTEEEGLFLISDLQFTDFTFSSLFCDERKLLKEGHWFEKTTSLKELLTLNLGHAQIPLDETVVQLSRRMRHLNKLTWYSAQTDVLSVDYFAQNNLTSLCLTFTLPYDTTIVDFLMCCQNLEELHFGMQFPENPTRFDLDVVLSFFSHIFNKRVYRPADVALWRREMIDRYAADAEEKIQFVEPVPASNGAEADYILHALPNLKRLYLWQAPEKIFSLIANSQRHLEDLGFGQLSPCYRRLCLVDCLLQALFYYDPTLCAGRLVNCDKLWLRLQSVPVVGLDYYLPQIMKEIHEKLWNIRSIDMFVVPNKNWEKETMSCSWDLKGENQMKGRRSVRFHHSKLTHFAIHLDGVTMLTDFDLCLPPSLESLSLSLSLPVATNRKKRRRNDECVSSLVRLIFRLSDVNAFPELSALSIQVNGVRCAQILLNAVCDQLCDLKHLSVIAMPSGNSAAGEYRGQLVDLLRNVVESCPKLRTFSLSRQMIEKVIAGTKMQGMRLRNWRLSLSMLHEDLGMSDSCELQVKNLPNLTFGEQFYVVPEFPAERNDESDSDEEDEETGESSEEQGEQVGFGSSSDEGDEEDSFVVNDGEVEPSSETDELSDAERALEEETAQLDRRAKKRRVLSSSEESLPEEEPESEEDYADENELDESREMNPFVDDQAEEGSDSESEYDDENDLENLLDLDGQSVEDEELVERRMVDEVRKANSKKEPSRRRKKIIVSDSE